MADWLLYGVTGYTGKLIVREAVRRGMRPMVAGRDPDGVARVAAEVGCESRVFAIDRPDRVAEHLRGVQLVLNCAGPFARTAPILMAGCIEAGVSYLDITGEIDVIEQGAALDGAAKRAGITLLPAVGFDVVPSDCLAAMLAAEMPDAAYLTLAFTGAETSPGTAKTILANLPHGGRARIDGKIEVVPVAWKSRVIPFSTGPREASTIPWGDVSSAFYTTGIRNIDVYMAVDEVSAAQMRKLRTVAPLLKFGPVLKFAEWLVDRYVKGPNAEDLERQRVSLWGEVRDAAGRAISATMDTPNGYRLTALTAVAAVEQVLASRAAPGFQTPARAFGKEFILSIPGVQWSGFRSTTGT